MRIYGRIETLQLLDNPVDVHRVTYRRRPYWVLGSVRIRCAWIKERIQMELRDA